MCEVRLLKIVSILWTVHDKKQLRIYFCVCVSFVCFWRCEARKLFQLWQSWKFPFITFIFVNLLYIFRLIKGLKQEVFSWGSTDCLRTAVSYNIIQYNNKYNTCPAFTLFTTCLLLFWRKKMINTIWFKKDLLADSGTSLHVGNLNKSFFHVKLKLFLIAELLDLWPIIWERCRNFFANNYYKH
jgi:uncharacterized membrane protein